LIDDALQTADPEGRVLLLLARAHLDAYEGVDTGLAAATYTLVSELAERLADPGERAVALRLAAFSLGQRGDHPAAVAMAAEHARAAGEFREAALADIMRARNLRHAAGVRFDAALAGQDLLAVFVAGITGSAATMKDADMIEAIADAIGLRLPARFDNETARLRAAAAYLRGGTRSGRAGTGGSRCGGDDPAYPSAGSVSHRSAISTMLATRSRSRPGERPSGLHPSEVYPGPRPMGCSYVSAPTQADH
jgi:hypothetical protein